MTRQECETKLLELVKQADTIYHEYNPDGDRLNLSCYHGQISVNGMHKDTDIENADYGNPEKTYLIYATEFPDGDVWHTDRWMRAYGRTPA